MTSDETKERVRAYWDDRADSFDDDKQHGIHDAEQREAWLSVLRSWTEPPPRRILDVGCGTGVISLLLAEIGHDVTGVDVSPEMVERAREKAQGTGYSVEFRTGDAEELEEPDDGYDAVVGRHLVWTLPDPSKAVREWQRVVRPGGRVVLSEGHWDFPEPFEGYEEIHTDLPLYDGRRPEELATFLAEQGLRDCESESLMDAVLWGEDPNYEQYVLSGRVE